MDQREAAVRSGEGDHDDAQDRDDQEGDQEQRDDDERRDLRRARAEAGGEATWRERRGDIAYACVAGNARVTSSHGDAVSPAWQPEPVELAARCAR